MGERATRRKGESPSARVRATALMGLLFALAMALSLLEGMVPSFLPVPGIKLGLSNVVVMYCVFVLGRGRAFALALLKALFTLLVRGASSALMSLCGGVVSVAVMSLLVLFGGGRVAGGVVAVAGAVCHNTAQLAAASLYLRVPALWAYLPVLVAAGIVTGLFTGLLLRSVMPLLRAFRGGGPPV